VDPAEQTLHVRTEHESEIAIPQGYLDGGHLDHGYAMTIHKAQGATFDQALVLADETMSGERAYTGLSRGRDANELYVVDADPARERHAPEIEPEPLDALATQLKTSSADVMALDLADSLDELGLGL
jgi:ATP-dependent exoDNAse (exonuclease V) alpha subunit